jgi:hypothetical protein
MVLVVDFSKMLIDVKRFSKTLLVVTISKNTRGINNEFLSYIQFFYYNFST